MRRASTTIYIHELVPSHSLYHVAADEFGQKMLMISCGKVRSEVAKMNDISLRSYSKYECGHTMMLIKTLFKLARFYDVKVTYLVDENPNS